MPPAVLALLLLTTVLSEPTRYVMDELSNPTVVTTVDMEVDGEDAAMADAAQVLSEEGEGLNESTQGDSGTNAGEPHRWPGSNPRRPSFHA